MPIDLQKLRFSKNHTKVVVKEHSSFHQYGNRGPQVSYLNRTWFFLFLEDSSTSTAYMAVSVITKVIQQFRPFLCFMDLFARTSTRTT